MDKISIIIVNWNSGYLLRKCLQSISHTANQSEIEIIVVDNNSVDKSAENIAGFIPNVHIIRNPANLGFAKANNQALKLSSGKYTLMLNPDVEIMDGALQKMADFLESNENAGAVGPKMFKEDGNVQYFGYYQKLPNLVQSLAVYMSFESIYRYFKPLYRKYFSDLDFGRESEVEQIPGACLMVKREVIEKIGFLDERFFVWMEDVDFCNRISELGYKLYYLPNAEVRHIGGVSFKKLKKIDKTLMWSRSAILYYLKNKSIVEALILSLLLMPKIVIQGLLALFGRQNAS